MSDRGQAVDEITGTLDGSGLPDVVGIFASPGKSGFLRIAQGRSYAELALGRRRIVDAVFDEERGLAAIDALLLALHGGRFEFVPTTVPPLGDLNMSVEGQRRYAAALSGTR